MNLNDMNIEPITATRVAEQIQNIAEMGKPMSWVRETVTNAAQAEATTVHFSVEWEAVREGGLYRRVVFDNGHGMTEAQSREFQKFGGSGNAARYNEGNYGYGAKVSLKEWNPRGIAVITRAWDGDGTRTLMFMMKSTSGTDFGTVNLPSDYDPSTGDITAESTIICLEDWDAYPIEESYESPFGDTKLFSVDWVAVANSVFGSHPTGTAIVLMGDDNGKWAAEDNPWRGLHTIMGDPKCPGESRKYAVRQFISGHFYDNPLPDGIHVTEFNTYSNASKRPDTSLWPRTPSESDKRRKKSESETSALKHAIQRPNILKKDAQLKSGTIKIPSSVGGIGANVDWTFVDDDALNTANQDDQKQTLKTAAGDRHGYPITAAVASLHAGISEVFDLESTGAAKQGDTRYLDPRVSSIVRAPSVAARCSFIFHPQEDREAGITLMSSNSARSGLAYRTGDGSNELPWRAWCTYLSERLPKPISDAVYRDFNKNVSLSDDLPKSVVAKLSSNFLPIMSNSYANHFVDDNGTVTGRPTDIGVRAKSASPHGIKKKAVGSSSRNLSSNQPNTPGVPDGSATSSLSQRNNQMGLVEVNFNEDGESRHILTWVTPFRSALVHTNSPEYRRIFDAATAYILSACNIPKERSRAEATHMLIHTHIRRAVYGHATTVASAIAGKYRTINQHNTAMKNQGDKVHMVYTSEETAAMSQDYYLSAGMSGLYPTSEIALRSYLGARNERRIARQTTGAESAGVSEGGE